jgi:adenylate cyclase
MPTDPSNAKAVIRVLDGRSKDATLELGTQATYTMGRGHINSLQILDRNISREHCKIEFDGRYYWLVDLDSDNGTFVNDERVQRYMLYDGDVIRIGKSTCLFQLLEPQKSTA